METSSFYRIGKERARGAERTCTNAESDRARAAPDESRRAHAAEEREEDAEDAVVACLDESAREKGRIVHQLDPDGRQDDGGAELCCSRIL